MKTRFNNISLYRVVAAVMILLFHLFFLYVGINKYTNLFSKFVQGLVCLSGFLYGGKVIINYRQFYLKNTKKILVPAVITILIFIIPTLILFIINPNNSYWSYWMEGNTFIFGNFWFIPMILVCYLLTPLLAKARDTKKAGWIMLVILTCLIELSLGFAIEWFPYCYIAYVIGYYLGSNKTIYKHFTDDQYHIWSVLISILVFELLMILFVLSPHYGIADQYISNVLSTLIGAASFFVLASLFKFINKAKFMNNICLYSDKIAYPFYLFNQVYMTGAFAILKDSPLYVSYPLILLATLASAIVLAVLYHFINKIKFSRRKVE